MSADPLHARLTDWVVANLAVPDVLTFDAEDVADRLVVLVQAEVERANGAEVAHECPLDRDATTPCCGKSPLELHPRSRMTVQSELITCPKRETTGLAAERDRLRAALGKVLGEFNQDVSEYNEELPWFSAQLTPEELTEARKALEGKS